jgi:hypothetical protein
MEVFKRGTGFGLSSAERHLAREKRPISHEMPQEITGKMPVPRYFVTPSRTFAVDTDDVGNEYYRACPT